MNRKQIFASVLSFFIVAFGQPAWSGFLGLVTAVGGYALFWWAVLPLSTKMRFWMATLWFGAVHFVQLSWFLSHPYLYIVVVHLLFAALLGLQFGLFTAILTKERLRKPSFLWGMAALWTLFEWARLFFMSGYALNPAGLALAGYTIPLQTASLFGVYGMTFWVIVTNLYLLRWSLFSRTLKSASLWLSLASFPYLFGAGHLVWHSSHSGKTLSVLIVDTVFPVEEFCCNSVQEVIAKAQDQWQQVIAAMSEDRSRADLVILPEGFAPFGTDALIHTYEAMQKSFIQSFGVGVELPPAVPYRGMALANNAHWAKGLASAVGSPVIVGLETPQKEGVYNAAVCFYPEGGLSWYGKRVLIPMGEYIPGRWLKPLAAKYGIQDSYAMGFEAKVFQGKDFSAGLSVCYEEIIGHIIRESRLKGANLLVNITNDGWYPDSRLAQQHFEHARLRSVENGVPLVRSCNFGVSAAVDSLGRDVVAGVKTVGRVRLLRADVPMDSYRTLYLFWGNGGILAVCWALLSLAFFQRVLRAKFSTK